MPKPWEEYQQQTNTVLKQKGPWEEYASDTPQPRNYTLKESLREGLNPVRIAESGIEVGKNLLQLPEVIGTVAKNTSPEEAAVMIAQPQIPMRKIAKIMKNYIVDNYGSYEKAKRKFAEDPVGTALDLSGVLSGLGGATGSRALLAAGKYTNPLELIGVAGKGVAKVGGVATDIMTPKTNTYIAAKGPSVLEALKGKTEIVPGSKPTAAQAAANTGVVEFASLGEQAKKLSGMETPYSNIAETQKAAQLRQIGKVAGTETQMKKAKAIREKTASDLYGKAATAEIPIIGDEEFAKFTKKPSFRKAVERADDLAKEKGEKFFSGDKIKGSSLHYIKTALDDLISNPERFGIGAQEAQSIMKTRNDYLKWVEKKSPVYKQARQTYSKQSEPVTQMEIGTLLKNKFEKSPRQFLTAMEEPQQLMTIKKATGIPRFEKLTEAMTPKQMKILNQVQEDIIRVNKAEELAGKAGPETRKLLGGEFAGTHGLNLLDRTWAVANYIFKRLGGGISKKAAMEIAAEMTTPEKAATAIEKAMTTQSRKKLLGGAARATGRATISRTAEKAGELRRKQKEEE